MALLAPPRDGDGAEIGVSDAPPRVGDRVEIGVSDAPPRPGDVVEIGLSSAPPRFGDRVEIGVSDAPPRVGDHFEISLSAAPPPRRPGMTPLSNSPPRFSCASDAARRFLHKHYRLRSKVPPKSPVRRFNPYDSPTPRTSPNPPFPSRSFCYEHHRLNPTPYNHPPVTPTPRTAPCRDLDRLVLPPGMRLMSSEDELGFFSANDDPLLKHQWEIIDRAVDLLLLPGQQEECASFPFPMFENV